MKTLQYLLVRLQLRRITRTDISRGILQKDIDFLQLAIHLGNYQVRAAAILGLGQLKIHKAIPVLIPMLWDDFETVARASARSLRAFLPNPLLEQQLQQAQEYWAGKKEDRLNRHKAIWVDKNNPLEPPAPLIDRSKMQRLAKVKVQLQKPIRL